MSLPDKKSPLGGRILVTGGAGFIGSALIWALNKRGITNIVSADHFKPLKFWQGVVPLDSNLVEKRRNLAPLKIESQFDVDLFENPSSVSQCFGNFSAVFHLGACSSTTEKNEAYLRANNFEFTQMLATWALGQGARFIYASSAATYGDGSAGMDDRDENLGRLQPLNLYGRSKNNFDLLAQREGYLHRIAGLKYFNVFGPNEDHKGDMRSLVNKAFHQITTSGRLQLFKSHRPDYRDGEQMRDFLYVKDAVEMTLHFAEQGANSGGLYNLGSGEANTWLTLAKAIFAALGREPAIDFIDMPEVLRDKYQYYTKADIGKLRESGYAKPMTPLAASVQDYVRNYLLPGRKLGEES